MTEYRLIIERWLGPRESRVYREEHRIRGEDAPKLARYWREKRDPKLRGWVEQRTTSLWEDFSS